MNQSSQSPGPAPGKQGSSGSLQFLRLVLCALLIFGFVFGTPYAIRYNSNAWTHGPAAITGSWVGILTAPPLGPAPDLSPSPFLSESNRQETIREQEEKKQASFESTRAVFITTSLDPFHLASASLRGFALMCGRDGTVIRYKFTPENITNDGMRLILYNDSQEQFGNLDATLKAPTLSVNFHGFKAPVLGSLARGSHRDFEQACSTVHASIKSSD